MYDTYAELLPVLTEWLTRKFPKTPEDTDFVYRQAIRAKALDATRGLLTGERALEPRHLRLGSGLRVAAPPHARAPAPRGPPLRDS